MLVIKPKSDLRRPRPYHIYNFSVHICLSFNRGYGITFNRENYGVDFGRQSFGRQFVTNTNSQAMLLHSHLLNLKWGPEIDSSYNYR